MAGDIADSAGTLDPAAYRAMALNFGNDKGIEYRYGPAAATVSNAGLPSYAKRPNQSYNPISIQNGFGDRSCGAQGWCGNWQIGGPLTAGSGDYSSSVLNFLFIPDTNSYFGMGSLQALSMAHNAFAFEPEPSWTSAGGANDDNGMQYTGRAGGSTVGTFPLEGPVAAGRCYGRGGWCTNTLSVFKDGRIVGSGSNTSRNLVTAKLPAGKVPTGITVTNSGEFALVSLWDTVNVKGQVAVIALADGCSGCDANNEGSWYGNWGNHHRLYHGLPGLGNYLGMKILGYVDLPDGMKAPTEISVSTGKPKEDYEVVRNFWNENVENNRSTFFSGQWTSAIARTGMAVVISKSEKKAAFIDLRPLFMYYRQQYFGQSQDGFNAMVANRGAGDGQWPYSFSNTPSQKPTVVKLMDLPGVPTAVKVHLGQPARAWIATQEGKLHTVDLGGVYLNQTATGGDPAAIRVIGAVDVGRNPTSISYPKGHGWTERSAQPVIYPNGVESEVIVTSRADRKIQWVRFDRAITGGSVARTLQDSKLLDPITAEDADNHATESYVLSVTDYAGKAVHNWMYGPSIWHSNPNSACRNSIGGCQMLNGQPFEYGGAFAVPGKPFVGVGANIN